MAVVVTGSAGFIGRHLVDALVAGGRSVVGIDRRAGTPAGATEVRADISQGNEAVSGALRAAEAVWHLAARPGVRDTGGDVAARRWRDNVVAGETVLRLVPPTVPVVVTSSSSVYGGSCLEGVCLRPSREDDRLLPLGGYARSKVELERLCRMRADRGASVAIARPFTVAGEGQRLDMAISVWLAALSQARPVVILGSPGRRRDVTDVRDVVGGLIRMGERETQGNVNLGSGRAHRIIDIARIVCDVAGRAGDIEVRPAGTEEVCATLADITRARRLLDYEPNLDLEDLVRRQAEAWTAGPGAPARSGMEMA